MDFETFTSQIHASLYNRFFVGQTYTYVLEVVIRRLAMWDERPKVLLA